MLESNVVDVRLVWGQIGVGPGLRSCDLESTAWERDGNGVRSVKL
jgi:hypothetical protein